MRSENFGEGKRLSTLRSFGVLDTPPDADLDAIVQMASTIFGVPISLITLLDEKRQWVKAAVGVSAKESPRDIAFCNETIQSDTVLVIEDARESAQFAGNPLVTGPAGVRFYAGAPLVASDGSRLGALCVIDKKPKKLSDEQKMILTTLAGMVIKYFELRRNKEEIKRERNFFHEIFEQASDIIYTADKNGNFVFVSPAAVKVTGYTPEELTGKHFTDLVAPGWKSRVKRFYIRQFTERTKETGMAFQIVTRSGEVKWVEQNVVLKPGLGKEESFQGIVRDVDSRKKTELELEEANKKIDQSRYTLQSVVDNTGSVIFIKDLQLQYTMVNKPFEEIFGHKYEEVKGLTDYDLWPEDVARSMQRSDRQVIRKLEALDFENALYLNNAKRIFLVRVFPLFDINNEICGVCGVYTEITAQKRAQDLLRERDKRFSKIFHASPAAMVLSSVSPNKLVEVNNSFTRMTGYRQQDLYGKSTSEIGMIDDKERQRLLNKFKEDGFLQNFEVTYMGADRAERTALVSTELVDMEGTDYALSLYYDITERKKFERELAEAKAQLSDALTIGRIGSFEFRIGDGRVTWSKEVYSILEMDYRAKPLTYDEYIKIIHPEDLAEVLSNIEQCMRDKKPDLTVNRFITATGKTRWVESRILPMLDADGDLYAFRGTMQDITERKEVEKNLVLAKQLAEKSAVAMEQFLANMSHEIRTPLNGLMGFTELLEKTKLSKSQSEYVNAISVSGKNLLTLINDILDYSKMEAGMLEIESLPFDLRQVCDNIMMLFSHKAAGKKVAFDLEFSKEAGGTYLGDPTRINQVLVNLVGNAIKFTNKGSVKLRVSVVSETNMSRRLRISVRDTGVGIPENKHSIIFERFSQASGDTARRFGGSGLGLSIAKGLVEMMGGKIDFTSQQNKGTEFFFELPLPVSDVKVAKKRLPAATKDKKALKGRTILLVEDNPFNSQLAKKVLTTAGAKVELAGNGKKALKKLESKQYDVILMDIQMPEMDGREATVRLRGEMGIKTPVIAMTAHAMQTEKQKCLEIGMNGYISKPFDTASLISAIVGTTGTVDKEVTAEARKEPGNWITDLSQLNSIAQGDQDFISQVLHMFVDIIPAEIARMVECRNTGNIENFRSAAHKLKSPLPLMGLTMLIPVLNALEGAQDFASVESDFEKLQQSCEQALTEVKQYISERSPA